MARLDPDELAARSTLAKGLRSVRLARQLSVAEVAERMGLSVRVYANFEAGRTGSDLARLMAFARITGCDALSLVRCAQGADPAIALASLDNQALSIAVGAVEDLVETLGSVASDVTTADLVRVFDAAQRELSKEVLAKSGASSAEADIRQTVLTPRQIQCLRWTQAGKSAHDIGVILGLSRRTVEEYILLACARLGVRTRMQAILVAIELGLLSPRAP